MVDQTSNIPLRMGIITMQCLFSNMEKNYVTEIHATHHGRGKLRLEAVFAKVALQPRDWMWSDPTLVLAKRLTDSSKNTNPLLFLASAQKITGVYAVSEGSEALRNTLTSFRKSSRFVAISLVHYAQPLSLLSKNPQTG